MNMAVRAAAEGEARPSMIEVVRAAAAGEVCP